MAGNYLKSLQLAKQLEERAKEASKNRKLAEEERESLEELLDQCKEGDVDLSDIEKLLSDFNTSMDSKDYPSAIAYASKAKDAAREAYIKKISDVSDSVETLLTLIRSSDGEPKGALELLEKSKKLAGEDDLRGAMKHARDAYDAGERAFHEHFSTLFSRAQETVNQAKETGDDVALFEDLLTRSKAALDKQDYENSITQLKEALEGAGENLRAQIEDTISSAENLIRAGQDIDADIERVNHHVERARSALDGLRYKDALSYAKRAESEGEKSLSGKLNDMVRDIRESIETMNTQDDDSLKSRQLLDSAQEAIRDKRFSEAINDYRKAREKIQSVHFQSVLRVIAKAKDKFVLAKKIGVDMSEAIRLLNASRESLKKGRFEEAINLAQESEDAVEGALQVFYKARDELIELTKELKAVNDLGLDTSDIKEMLVTAKKAFEKKDYSDASEATSNGISTARKKIFDVAKERIDRADERVRLGKMMSADVSEAEGLLKKASESLTGEDLMETVTLADSSLEAVDASLTASLDDKLKTIEEFVGGFPGEDDTMAKVGEDLAEARKNIESKEFQQAYEQIVGITDRLEHIGREECERLTKVAEDKLQMASTMGAGVSDSEVLMTRAKELYTKDNYQDSIGRLKDVISQVNEALFRLLQAEFSSIKDSMEEAKALGIDTGNAKDRLKAARAKVDSEEFLESYEMAVSTKDLVRGEIEKHDSIKDKVRRAEELIEEATKNKAETSKLTGTLDKAKEVFASGKLDDADKMLDGLIEETEKRLSMYLAAKFILTTKEFIDLGASHGVEMRDSDEMLGRAKTEMKNKDYDAALESAKRSSETAREALSEGVGQLIHEVQRMVTDAKNVSIDTASPERLIEKAVELAGSGDFEEALKCVDSAKEDIDHIRNLSSQAATDIKAARRALKEAETLNADVEKAEELLDQAVEALTRHQYAIALELAKRSHETSNEVTRESIRSTLDRFKQRIEDAASEGVPLGEAERCIAEGRQAFEDGRYQESLKLAMECEIEMERGELQKDISSKAVENARRKVTDAAAEGIKADRASEIVDRAEELLSKGKYTEALAAAIDSGDVLHQIREEFDGARIQFSAVREQIERLKKVNIDTSSCDEMLDTAHEYLSSHDFDKFSDALAKCSTKVSAHFQTSVNNQMDETRDMISKAKALGINTRVCEDLLEVAQTSFSEKLWDFAYQQAQDCRERCIGLVEKKIENLMRDADNRIEALGHVGGSVKSVRAAIDEAKSIAASGNHLKAFDILMEADKKILMVEESNKKYIDISIAAESSIENLRRLGGETKEADRLLALADLEKEKDYDSAIELVAEALDTARGQMEAFSPEVSATMETEGLYAGHEGEVTITLRNTGRAAAKAVTVNVAGEFDSDGVPGIPLLEPGKEAVVSAKVAPRAEGSLEVTATIGYSRPFDSTTDGTEVSQTFKVYPSGPPYKLGRATGVSKCVLCQGRIKAGFDILSCRCGSQLHLACAKRSGKCPVCGQKYEF